MGLVLAHILTMSSADIIALPHLMNGLSFRPRLLLETPWTGHIPFLASVFSAQKPGIFVELGVHKGASFLAACQAATAFAPDCRCHGIDTWEGDDHAVYNDGDLLYRNLCRQTSELNSRSVLIRGYFENVVGQFADASIDLLHIDGLHTYEAVRSDYETWLPKMSEKGIILFHDTCVMERGFGVHQFWDEVKDSNPSLNFRHSSGLGVLVVGKNPSIASVNLVQALGFEAVRRDFERCACISVDDFALGLSGIRQSLPKVLGNPLWKMARLILRTGYDFRKLDRSLLRINRADKEKAESALS
jgi:hypothetical protein